MTTERDIRNQIAYAKSEGREEGLVEGAADERLKIAKALIENGVKPDVIVASTGLTEEEIKSL